MRIRVKGLSKCYFENYTLPAANQIAVMYYPYPEFTIDEVRNCYEGLRHVLPEGTRSMGFPDSVSLYNLTKEEIIGIRDTLNDILDRWDEGITHDIDSETRTGPENSSGAV